MEREANPLPVEPPREEANVCEILQRRACQQRESLAYRFLPDNGGENALTYGELDVRAQAIGGWLQSGGLEGKPVALVFPPGLDFVAAFFGVLYGGSIAVPLNFYGSGAALDRMTNAIRDADTRIVLTVSNIAERVRKAVARIKDVSSIAIVAIDEIPQTSSMARQNVPADRLAILQYTSGSTANPKGVRIRHANLLSNINCLVQRSEMGPTSVGVSWLPHYHDMGLVGGIIAPLCAGFPVTLLSPVSFLRRPIRWLQAISRYGATVSASPNFGYELCAQQAASEALDEIALQSWRTAFSGAEPIQPDTLRRFAAAFERYGFARTTFFPCYGLAEATLMVAGSRWNAPGSCWLSREGLGIGRVEFLPPQAPNGVELASSGKVLDGYDVVIADPDSKARLPALHVGEIWVRGGGVGDGYWQRSSESTGTFCAHLPDGSLEGPFLRTGDLGFLNEGSLFVVGRLKDVLIVRGVKHYPNDIEHTLENCIPALRRGCGAVFSIEQDGAEHPVIVFELQGELGHPTVDSIFESIFSVVAHQHGLRIAAICLVKRNTVPKTSSGKVQRRKCRAQFLSGGLATIAEWRPQSTRSGSEAIEGLNGHNGATDASSRSPVLALLISVIADLLECDPQRIQPDQSIYGLGIDSLLATRLLSRMEDQLHADLQISDLLEASTIEEVAARISNQLDASGWQGTPGEAMSSLIERVANLSEEEVMALLASERSVSSGAGS